MLKRIYATAYAKVYEFFFQIVQHALQAYDFDKRIRFALQRDAHDIQKAVQLRALAESADFVQTHMSNVRSFETLEELWLHALEQVVHKDTGLYCEFGVWEAKSTNFFAKHVKTTIFGFDSFEGLPERWFHLFDKGHFKVERLPKVSSNVVLVQGLFENTLPKFVEEHRQNVAFLHLDCDLYSSSVTVFKHLAAQIITGTVIVFDEWYDYPGWKEGEYKAFMEFLQARGLSFEFLGYHRHDAQVAVRITARA